MQPNLPTVPATHSKSKGFALLGVFTLLSSLFLVSQANNSTGIASDRAALTNLANFAVAPVASNATTAASLNSNSPLNTQVAVGTGPIKIKGSDFVDSGGQRFFLSGVNYEGHTDRAWLLWNDDRFDPNLIGQDLALAAKGGYNSLRLFVQLSTRQDIINGRWDKLDKVFDLAAQNNLKILLTLADYDELDLGKLNQVDVLIAKHFAGSPTLLGYDLKNEPQFVDLAAAKYSDGKVPAIRTDVLINTYGERISQKDSDGWRLTAEGQKIVPTWLDYKAAYYYTNAYKIYLNFLDEGSKWVVQHTGSSFIDWLKAPDSVYWKTFVDTLSISLGSWISARQDPIKALDPDRPTTIGFNHTQFAFLKANDALGFVSIHRFDKESAASLLTTINTLEKLKGEHPAKPTVLEEFGYSNSHGANKNVPLNLTANYEAAIWLFLYSKGYAGGFKWMLTNFPPGSNLEENNYGLLDDGTNPKPAYFTARAIHTYIAANRTPSGDFSLLESRDGTELSYLWSAGDTVFGNLKDYTDPRMELHQDDLVGWQVRWQNNGQSQVLFNGAGKGRVSFDLGKFYPKWNPKGVPTLQADNGQPKPLDRKDNLVGFPVEPNQLYTLIVPLTPAAFQPGRALGVSNSLYFRETTHNLSGVFKTYWETHGGLALYGFPISEEFQEGDYTVQYFERNRFEFHPEAPETRNQVQLGLLGLSVAAGRKEAGDAPFLPQAAGTIVKERDFYKETAHSLGGSFRAYWQKYGGLAQFGFPISEEFSEVNPADGKSYTVQYFERARFELHPEAKGTPNEVQLGLLGTQVAKSKGWLP